MATYRQIDAKSALRSPGFVEPWFVGRWGMNLYRGCEHGCAYCDGRAEKYQVEGAFESDIVIKRNVAALFEQEARRMREPGFLFLGGGVCDAYQPVERETGLAREVLQIALQHGLSVHVLTKSALVQRDFDVLEAIARHAGVIVSFSINTLDDAVRQHFEPGASSIRERLDTLQAARARGLGTGIFAVPVLPGISDQPEAIDALAREARELGVDFLSFGGLTLRPGAQKQAFYGSLRGFDASLLEGYERLYGAERASGAPDPRYLARLEGRFRAALRAHELPGRVPHKLFHGRMPLYAEVAVLLEHREFEGGQVGASSAGLASTGTAIQRWAQKRLARHARTRGFDSAAVDDEFLSRVRDQSLLQVPGVTQGAWPVVQDILSRIL